MVSETAVSDWGVSELMDGSLKAATLVAVAVAVVVAGAAASGAAAAAAVTGETSLFDEEGKMLCAGEGGRRAPPVPGTDAATVGDACVEAGLLAEGISFVSGFPSAGSTAGDEQMADTIGSGAAAACSAECTDACIRTERHSTALCWTFSTSSPRLLTVE